MTNNQLTLSDFIVQKVIGEGSYGRAVLCKQISNNKDVVIKEISLKKLTEQEQRDAWKETKVLSLLHHPNIITYYGCFLQNNVLHIVMEYADNGDLSEEIRKSLNNNQHFDEDKILNWFVQICLAIKHLHDRKILHRDLKNQNIFLLKDNTAKLGDFGIAKMLSSTSQMSNTAIGTPYYLSPEICQGKSYNMKSDIWSLGCILYELCTLHHPFDSNCLNGLIVKIQRAKPPPIPYYYSSSLRNLVDKLLQKVPAKRPSINQILELDFIRCRVPNFLSYAIEKKEFCHTILHDFKPGESPEKAKVTPEDVENNNANLHCENNKDDNQNKGNRNRLNLRNRNNRQNAYKNMPRYSSNKNINSDNRRRLNNDEDKEIKSPRLQCKIHSSPQIPQQQPIRYSRQERNNDVNIISDFEQQSEKGSVKSNETEAYMSTDESSEFIEDNIKGANYQVNNIKDNHPYRSNQNYNYENKANNGKNNQRKSVIRRRKFNRNDDNQVNSPYVSPMINLQAKKNAAVIADRALARELREKKAVEEKIIQLKNEEKRREVQEKAKAREIERKEQMRRLKQEEKERQEKYKKLKPTFRIDRNVHYHNNTDSESNDSIFNSNSDFDHDERKAERIKKRKEEEIKKENLKRNASAIAEKIKNNHIYENQENESDSNKKQDNNISALREFLHQRRSEIRKNKQQENVIMIGNIKYYVNDSNNAEDSDKNENNEKEISARNNKKQIENDVYGLIFDNNKSNDNINLSNDQNNNENIANSEGEITKTEIHNTINSYSSEQLLTSDSANASNTEINKNSQNNSILSNNSNENIQNSNTINANDPSYISSPLETNDEFQTRRSNNNSNNPSPSMLSFSSNSPSSIKEKRSIQIFSPSEAKLYNNSDNEITNQKNIFNDGKKVLVSPNGDCNYSPMQSNSIKTPSSDYDYSPRQYNNNSNRTSNNDYEYSPLQFSNKSNKTTSNGCEYSPPQFNINCGQAVYNDYDYSPIKSNDGGKVQRIVDNSNINSGSVSCESDKDSNKNCNNSPNCVFSPTNQLTYGQQFSSSGEKQTKVIIQGDAANHKNTIMIQIDKLLMDSLSNSELVEDELLVNKKSGNTSPLNDEKKKESAEDQNTEISISINDEIVNKSDSTCKVNSGNCIGININNKSGNSINSNNDDQGNINDYINNHENNNDNNNNNIINNITVEKQERSPSSLHKMFFSDKYNFTFRGVELQFDNIKSNDSLAYKIETVRKFIEDSLGIDKSIKAYRLAEENNLSNYKEILTTPDQQSFYPLILQLLSSEEILLAKWLK